MTNEAQYTVIIPTMFYHPEQLQKMLDVYETIPSICEVLIVNNNKVLEIDLKGVKSRKIGLGINLFVNPSWRLGATVAKTENIILANDDMYVKGDIEKLLQAISKEKLEGKVFGPAATSFRQKGSLYKGDLILEECHKRPFNYGFGVFMILTKTDYLKTICPKEIKVWYGDMILYNTLQPWNFKGIEIVTQFAGTTSKIDLRGVALKEKRLYTKLGWQKQRT